MPLNNTITIRRAAVTDAGALAKVHVRAWQESYKGIVEQSYLDGLSVQQKTKSWEHWLSVDNGVLHLVACNAKEEVIGFSGTGPLQKNENPKSTLGGEDSEHGFKGEIYAIYLLKSYKRQGIGTALWEKCTEHLAHKNLTPYLVWALEGNVKARRFYEAQGGLIMGEKKTIIGDLDYKEVGYSFKNPL